MAIKFSGIAQRNVIEYSTTVEKVAQYKVSKRISTYLG